MQREYPSRWYSTVGTSYNPGVAFQLIPPAEPGGEWRVTDPHIAGTVMAHGDGQAPAGVMDPLQGRLIARQRARQDARRNLARKVEATEVLPGVTVASILEKDSRKKEEVETFIRSASQKGVMGDAAGSCTVFLSLDLSPLNEILGDGSAVAFDYSSSMPLKALTPDEARKRSSDEAIEDARARMLEYVKGLVLPEGGTVGDCMLQDDQVDQAIRLQIKLLRPRVEFKGDDTCEATLLMNIANVQRILDERKGMLGRLGFKWPKLRTWSQKPNRPPQRRLP